MIKKLANQENKKWYDLHSEANVGLAASTKKLIGLLQNH